jgi:hypothetical protein
MEPSALTTMPLVMSVRIGASGGVDVWRDAW